MRQTANALQEPDLADQLDVIADRVRRLAPCHREPERFHIEKDDLVNELKKIVADLPRGWTQMSDQNGQPKCASFTFAPGFVR